MKQRVYRRTNLRELRRRRQEIASLWLWEDYTVKEIVENSVYSEKTIQRDIDYIESHMDEFV